MLSNGIRAKDCLVDVEYSGGVVIGVFWKDKNGQWHYKPDNQSSVIKVYPHESHLFYPLRGEASFTEMELRSVSLELERLKGNKQEMSEG